MNCLHYRQHANLPIKTFDVYIERGPGSGQPSDVPTGEEEMYRVPVHEERMSIQKQPAVREEITLGKRRVLDTQWARKKKRGLCSHLYCDIPS